MQSQEPRQPSGFWDFVFEFSGQILGELLGEMFVGLLGLMGHIVIALLEGIFFL